MNSGVRAVVLLGLTLSAGLLPLSVCPSVAQAQDDAATIEARKRFMEGVKLFDEKKFDLARAAFLQAYALKKHPDVLLNLAQSELMSDKPLDAAQHFKEFLRDPANEKHPKRGDAVRGLDESRQKLGRLQITVDQSDAEVFVDGKKLGTSPLSEPLDVTPGQHSVEARKGGKTVTQTVGASDGGKIQIVNLVLTPPTAGITPPPPATTTEPVKQPPPVKPPPPPPGEGDRLIAPQPTSLTGQRETFSRWAFRSPVSYVGAGLTVAGLGVGIGFAIAYSSARGKADDLTNQITQFALNDNGLRAYGDPARNRTGNPCASPVATKAGGADNDYSRACANLRANLDDSSRNRTVMTVGFVAAGVGVVTMVGGYFLTARRSDAAALTMPRFAITPVLTPDTRGIGAIGSF